MMGLGQHQGSGPVAIGAPGSAGVRALSRGAGATDRAGHELGPPPHEHIRGSMARSMQTVIPHRRRGNLEAAHISHH